MKRMRERVNKGTKLIYIFPWTYYLGMRQWSFAQRVAISTAGIWPRAVVSWRPLDFEYEWDSRPSRARGKPVCK